MAFTADEAYTLLQRAHAMDRLAHAYLITGADGSGARELAIRLAGLLVGRSDAPLKHPDVHYAEPESKSRRIKVEAAREIERQLQLRSMSGGRKVAIFFDADRMMESAANAFLKTLEEPPANSHVLLVTALPDQLLDTILSRCIEVPLRLTERRTLTERQQRLLALVRDFSKIQSPGLAQIFTLVREFQTLLAEAKEAISDQNEAALKAEVKQYRDTTDISGEWIEERENYFKALTESRYRQEREVLLEVIEQWWADVLRQQHGAGHLDLPEVSADTAALASRLPAMQIVRRAEAMAALRENFGRNVQEQLAVEVALMESFAA